MTTIVFMMMVYLGNVPEQERILFYDINRCKYFASRIMGQPPEPVTGRRYTAICKPVNVNLDNPNLRVF